MQSGCTIAVASLVVLTAACGGDVFDPTGPSQLTTFGSGRIVSEPRALQGFTSVAVAGGLHAIVSHGGESLEITTDDNLLALLESSVVNGRLVLGWRQGSSVSAHTAVCRIGVRTLDGASGSGGSRIEVEGINAPDFAVDLSGAAAFTGSGAVDRLRLDLSGASTVEALSLSSRTARAALSGASVARIRVRDELTVTASGASLLEFVGDPAVHANTSGGSFVRRIGS